MSVWLPVIALFWAFWAVDGVRLLRQCAFTVAGRLARGRGRMNAARWSVPSPWPWGARVIVSDVPFTVSPAGISNRPAGTVGRPTEQPGELRVWRWSEIRQAGQAKGWLFINHQRFCPATGHIGAAELLALADAAPAERERRLRLRLRRWLRPAHLRRRARVLTARTRAIATWNATTLALLALVTAYVTVGVVIDLPERWTERIGNGLPMVLGTALVFHLLAAIAATIEVKRLRAVAPEKRGTNLFSAWLLPAQALRLRALLGEGYFPAQHPLAVVLALGRVETRRDAAFAVLADLRWPIHGREDPPLAREIAAWFREALEPLVRAGAERGGVGVEALLAPPMRERAGSCRYCPRCGDQFGAGTTICPNGVTLAEFEARPAVR